MDSPSQPSSPPSQPPPPSSPQQPYSPDSIKCLTFCESSPVLVQTTANGKFVFAKDMILNDGVECKLGDVSDSTYLTKAVFTKNGMTFKATQCNLMNRDNKIILLGHIDDKPNNTFALAYMDIE